MLHLVRHRRPIEDELLESKFRVAPDEFVEGRERREGFRFGSVGQHRPANLARVPAKFMAVLLQEADLLASPLKRLSERYGCMARFRQRLATKRVPDIRETSGEPEGARHLPRNH